MERLQFRLNLMEKTLSPEKNTVIKFVITYQMLQLLQWYKSFAEQGLGLMEDKVLHFSEGVISVFYKLMILMFVSSCVRPIEKEDFLLNIVLMDLREVTNG